MYCTLNKNEWIGIEEMDSHIFKAQNSVHIQIDFLYATTVQKCFTYFRSNLLLHLCTILWKVPHHILYLVSEMNPLLGSKEYFAKECCHRSATNEEGREVLDFSHQMLFLCTHFFARTFKSNWETWYHVCISFRKMLQKYSRLFSYCVQSP